MDKSWTHVTLSKDWLKIDASGPHILLHLHVDLLNKKTTTGEVDDDQR